MSVHVAPEPAAAPPPQPVPPEAGRTDTTWLFRCALTAAAVCVGFAIHIRDGEYWPTAIPYVGWAIALCGSGVAFARGPRTRWGGHLALATAFVGVLFQFAQLFTCSPSGSNWWSDDLLDTSAAHFRVYTIGLRAAWGLLLLSLWRFERWGKYVFPLVIGCHLVLGAWMIRSSPRPHIDVFVFQQVGGQALLHGDNPYAITYPDIYQASRQGDRPVYGVGLMKDGQLQFGFPYPPLSLLLSTAGYAAAGDHRYAQLFAMALAGALIAYARPSRVSVLAAAGLLFTPRAFFILGRGWTEPFVVLGLAGAVFVVSRRWGARRAEAGCGVPSGTDGPRPTFYLVVLGIALGLFLATKQYLIFAVPLAFLLLPRLTDWRGAVLLLGTAAVVLGLVTLDFLVRDWHAFVHSTITVQKVAPFREDALSYLVSYAQRTGVRLGAWPAFVAVAPAMALALWRAPRGAAGFAAGLAIVYLIFIALNKQAFANYYYFTIGALWCAVAVAGEGDGQASSALG